MDHCTKEFDIEGLEGAWNRHWAELDVGRRGALSVVAPRVCTHDSKGVQESILQHRFDRMWQISPWEIEGKPGPDGKLAEPSREREFGAPAGFESLRSHLELADWPKARERSRPATRTPRDQREDERDGRDS